jgi:O-antigen/teichoic acid export membrane protein
MTDRPWPLGPAPAALELVPGAVSAEPAAPVGLRDWAPSTAALAARSITAQVIVLLAGIGAARLYTPVQFGAAASFVAGVGLVGVVSALRYDLAIAVATDEGDAERLLVLSVVMVATTAVVVGTFAIVAGPWLLPAFGVRAAVSDLRFIAPAGIAALGFVGVAVRWATRRRRYALIGRTRIRQAVSQGVAQLGLGVAGLGVWGLALAGLAGSCAGGVRLATEPLAVIRAYDLRGQRGAIWRTARRYRQFPTFSLFATLCHGLATAGVPIVVAALYGLRMAGYLVLAQRVVTIPLRLLGEAISGTYLGDSSLLRRIAPGAVRSRLRQTTAMLAILALVPLAILVVAGPELFSFVFGRRWHVAGELARPLCVLAAAQLVVWPILQTFAVLARLKFQAGLAIAQLALTLGPLLAAHAAGASLTVAVSALSLGGVLAYLLHLIMIDRIAGLPTEGGNHPLT